MFKPDLGVQERFVALPMLGFQRKRPNLSACYSNLLFAQTEGFRPFPSLALSLKGAPAELYWNRSISTNGGRSLIPSQGLNTIRSAVCDWLSFENLARDLHRQQSAKLFFWLREARRAEGTRKHV